MKKMFTIGLLALAISTSASAKNVEKFKITTKHQLKKAKLKSQDPVDCNGGMTSCGRPYIVCGGAAEVSAEYELAVWEFEDYYYCVLGGN